jgi:tetratricopeptide (TPR) repeat protein
MWSRAAARAAADHDDAGFEVLRDRIAALDPAAGAALEGAARADAPEVSTDSDSDIDFEVDGLEESDDFEIDVSVGDEDEAPGVEADVQAGEVEIDLSGEDEDSLDAEEDFDFDIDVEVEDDDVDEDEADEEPDVQVAESAEPQSEAASSTTASQQVSEDLEEAEFYYQQDLFDEAEAIYRRILKIAPNHPSALLRLGELAAAKGDDPAAATGAKASEEIAANPADERADEDVEIATDEEGAIELDFDEDEHVLAIDVDGDEDDAPEVVVAAPGDDCTEVADFSLDDDEDDEPTVQMDLPPAAAAIPDSPPRAVSRADDTVPLDEVPDLDEDEDEDQDGGFDLAAELRDVIEEDEDSDGETGSSLSTVEDGFESIFADFKQGVSATLSDDDYETRYDLGIAYREMELYDDAIGEFRMCLDSPSWKLASLHLMGLCALDLDRAQDATNHLEQALATPDLPDEQIAGLQFDLGRALEVAGDMARARSAYESALAADSSLPGVSERLAGLANVDTQDQSGSAPDGEAGESFESFDDIVAEAQEDDDDTTEQTESFESFDDLITEAEADMDDAPSVEVETVAEAETSQVEEAPEPEPAPKPKKKKRKKKISFV